MRDMRTDLSRSILLVGIGNGFSYGAATIQISGVYVNPAATLGVTQTPPNNWTALHI